MAIRFIKNSLLNSCLEKIVENAQIELYLICPFIKLKPNLSVFRLKNLKAILYILSQSFAKIGKRQKSL